MSTAADEVISDPQAEAKVSVVLAALGRDGALSYAEKALADELAGVPAVAAARAAHSARLEAAQYRKQEAELAELRAQQAAIEAETAAEVAARRAAWREADPLVRALHLLAKEIRPDRQGKILLRLAQLVENPSITLRKPAGLHPWGETFPASDRPPPATFRPLAPGLDPEDG